MNGPAPGGGGKTFAAPGDEPGQRPGPRLLLVGPPASRTHCARCLEDDFASIVEAPDADGGVSAAQGQTTDLGLIDVDNGGGVADFGRLLDEPTLSGVPLIAIVDAGSATQTQAVLERGAVDALARPPAPAQLRTRARTWLLRKRVADGRRLAAVHATGLLDAPASPFLDRLTRETSSRLGVPTAILTLVDRDRQFFVSGVGVPEPWASARQTPLAYSFCQHVAATGAPFIVSDARVHPLVQHNRAVCDLNVVSYAGVPLTSAGGETLGSFCAVDTVPREWTAEQIAILRSLAAEAATALQAPTAR